MNKKIESFIASYLSAYRIYGYLKHEGIFNYETTDEEASIICIFAEAVRETVKETVIRGGLVSFKYNFGLDGIIIALEYDLKTRGIEWSKGKLAEQSLELLNKIQEI